MQLAAAVALMPLYIFAAYTAAITHNVLLGATTPKFPHLGNTWFIGPNRVYPPTGISIGSIVFAGLTNVTNRQDRHTDRPRYSVCSNRPYLVIAAMWPKKASLFFS